jgi:hypothetical protein
MSNVLKLVGTSECCESPRRLFITFMKRYFYFIVLLKFFWFHTLGNLRCHNLRHFGGLVKLV